MSLSEERVRIIVREEISRLLDDVGKKVGAPEHLEVERMEDAMMSILHTVAEKEAKDAVNTHEDYYDIH